jgi:hypothetical protein
MASLTTTEIAAAKTAILTVAHYTTEEVIDLLGGNSEKREVARLREQSLLVALRFPNRGYLYPAFQFDKSRPRILPSVASVNRKAGRLKTVPQMIIWWITSADGRTTPMDLALSGNTEQLNAACNAFTRT